MSSTLYKEVFKSESMEIATFITYLPVELIFETSQFGFKDLSFSTR